MHGRGPEHRTFGTELLVCGKSPRCLKTGKGLADRSEGHRSCRQGSNLGSNRSVGRCDRHHSVPGAIDVVCGRP